jgi:hypothetical protein
LNLLGVTLKITKKQKTAWKRCGMQRLLGKSFVYT